MTFNKTKKDWVFLLAGRVKPPFARLKRNLSYKRVGARLKSTDIEPLPIVQPIGFIVGKDEDELKLKDELAEWLVTEEPAPLQFDDEPGRTYYAAVQNTLEDFGKFINQRSGTIQFICPDPYGYGSEHDLNLSTTFTTYSIRGLVRTPWISRTVFSSSLPSYTLENNQGGKITIKFNFITGDVLEIDYKKRKVTLNGNVLGVSFDSVWFDLKPGQIQLRASNVTTVTYTERYY